MELIERYIYAVSKNLPLKQQADIEKELRGLIEDMLLEKTNGSEATIRQVEEVLTELGEPSQLAEKYQDKKRYVIGPEIYGKYVLILKLVLSVVLPIVAVVNAGLLIFKPLENLTASFAEYVGILCSTAITAIFYVTLVFFLVDRLAVSTGEVLNKSSWKPSDLSPVSAKRLIQVSDAVAGIVFYTVLIGVFGYAHLIIGAHIKEADGYSFTPLLNMEIFRAYLPVLLTLYGLSLVKEVGKLIYGNWIVPLWGFNLILNVSIAVFYVIMLSNSNILNSGFIDLVANMTETSRERIIEISGGFKIFTAITIAFWRLWDTVDSSLKMRRLYKIGERS